jgi:hypothetical protein
MSEKHQDLFFEDMKRDVAGEINKMLATIELVGYIILFGL